MAEESKKGGFKWWHAALIILGLAILIGGAVYVSRSQKKKKLIEKIMVYLRSNPNQDVAPNGDTSGLEKKTIKELETLLAQLQNGSH